MGRDSRRHAHDASEQEPIGCACPVPCERSECVAHARSVFAPRTSQAALGATRRNSAQTRCASARARSNPRSPPRMLSVEGPMARTLSSCCPRVAAGWPNTSCFELFGLDVMLDANGKPCCHFGKLGDPAVDLGVALGCLATAGSNKLDGSQSDVLLGH